MIEPTEKVWGWWASRDGGEYFQIGPEATREAAIAAAMTEEYGAYQPIIATDPETGVITYGDWRCQFVLMEAVQRGPIDLADHFAAYDWFEELDNGALGDLGDPGGDGLLVDITKLQAADLDLRVQAVIREWQATHNIVVSPWAFAETRNAEDVDLPMPTGKGHA